jgi:hypothetical protein
VSSARYELDFISQKTTFFIDIVPVKSLQLPEGQTGNAWEPSKPMINSVPPPPVVSLTTTHFSVFIVFHRHRRENLKSYKASFTYYLSHADLLLCLFSNPVDGGDNSSETSLD